MNNDIYDILKKCGLKQEILENDFTSDRLQRILTTLESRAYYKLGYPEVEVNKDNVYEELYGIVSTLIKDGNFYYERDDDGTIANESEIGVTHKIDSMNVDDNGNIIAVEEKYSDFGKEKRIREFDKSGVQLSIERIYDCSRLDLCEHCKVVRNPDFVTETVYVYPIDGSDNYNYTVPAKVCQRFCDYSFEDNEHGLFEIRQKSVGEWGANKYRPHLFPRRIPVPKNEEDIKLIMDRKRMLLLEALENGLSYSVPRIISFANSGLNNAENSRMQREAEYAKQSFLKYALEGGIITEKRLEDGILTYEINEDVFEVNPKDFEFEYIESDVQGYKPYISATDDMDAQYALKEKFKKLEEKYRTHPQFDKSKVANKSESISETIVSGRKIRL